ncbi:MULTISPECIES: hypothetical protein [Vibrio]|uniref:hypothetical protein n=1 Tax=Vibrio TaxID=662 RepID=UPI0004DF86D9|nr:hypothetical protein [Vibrio parahaemolyticus]EGQ9239489.1 hypothetical protein [Vibrio vulnificus]EHD1698131.1 hypothetical protein [Vibrio vulnificus]EKZ9225860.1 hypothetical protein [Vibrio vulnificus]ELC9582702.1 hypothetical protein [Vibrio vulnificus]MCU8149761.1 hypothetical protein [Vibrio vulnificus]
MPETSVAQSSKLESILSYIASSEIPALYYLVERVAFLGGLILLGSAVMMIYRIRSITGNYSMMSMQMADASLKELFAKVTASVFLGSFGIGQAMISNTLFLQSFEPYSVEVLRSISCSSGDSVGCIHYELGMFESGSWMQATINQTFFEFFTATVAIYGSICYALGWFAFSKLGASSGGAPTKSFWAVSIQIIFGSFLMRPTETWLLFTGGAFN